MIPNEVLVKSLTEVGTTVLYVLIGTAILEAVLYLVLMRWLKYRYALPFMLLAPAIVGLATLTIYPLLWELRLSFTNMSLRAFKDPQFIGLTNYVRVFTEPVLKQTYFFPLLGRTVLWTLINVMFHVIGGMVLALLLNRPMRGKGIYRMFLIIPWAVPQVIAVLAWRGEFHYEFGFINIILRQLGMTPVQWLSDPTANFLAMCITNIWLGIPFMMVILLGGLQSIAGDYYEAAEIDGANGWQKFWMVTVPLMRPVTTPVIILGTVWTFNNFNIPFFINQNELESSDILVTGLFRAAFQYNRYGFSAAFAFVIFGILLAYSIFYLKTTGGLKGATE
ncbi:carbohydrate ABC transporter permease [Levilinea saccharolytica]|uniref:ABC transporter n=1 Tax=Levilinea saccharolytica TaxID=229921 RepID=A0A0P6XR21_9CHLR|nr:sugar ABC transporter permease [Levilinea saccharolytica]KPL81841.1 ABC transporter [Levilinea saccharolytica]GAP17676.1 carbohydrate ABC transporter membrane protein 1, CUT1 family [Levilinea saccharolytica]